MMRVKLFMLFLLGLNLTACKSLYKKRYDDGFTILGKHNTVKKNQQRITQNKVQSQAPILRYENALQDEETSTISTDTSKSKILSNSNKDDNHKLEFIESKIESFEIENTDTLYVREPKGKNKNLPYQKLSFIAKYTAIVGFVVMFLPFYFYFFLGVNLTAPLIFSAIAVAILLSVLVLILVNFAKKGAASNFKKTPKDIAFAEQTAWVLIGILAFFTFIYLLLNH